MRNSRNLWGAIALCVLATPAFAGLIAPASLSGLQQQADLIIVGGVTSAFSGVSSVSFFDPGGSGGQRGRGSGWERCSGVVVRRGF